MFCRSSVNRFTTAGKPITLINQLTIMYNHNVSISGMLTVALLIINAVILETAAVKNADWFNALWVSLPLLAIAIYNARKKKTPAAKNNADSFHTS
ncbi:hypothetical protein CAP36_15790 [Chitinophagaceae bacterium IBVUCB2]|nr:hypothetical protein CAP36_15790 [Chitinophagaceae bacterium IBVUCB2]